MNRAELLSNLVFAGLMSAFLCVVISGVLVAVFNGIGPAFPRQWLVSTVLAFVIAWPTSFIAEPLVTRIQAALPLPGDESAT